MFKWDDSKIRAKIMAAAEKNLTKTIVLMVGSARADIAQEKHGRAYARRSKSRSAIRYRGKGYIYHIASAPGEAPASDSGYLMGSITWDMPMPLVRRFGVNTGDKGYGGFLELGTSRMAPRPYLRPAFDVNKDRFGEYMRNSV